MENRTGSDQVMELARWKFQIDQQDFGESDGWMLADHSHDGWLDVTAYRAWDTYEFALRNYEGIGWYYTEFPASDLQQLYHSLAFDGVGGTCKVWVNGCLCAENDSRYLPFRADIQPFVKSPGMNCVTVKVDNRFRGKAFLPGAERIEWVQYGGLTHAVRLVMSPLRSLSDLRLKAEADGQITGTVMVHNRLPEALQGELRVAVENASTTTAIDCPGHDAVVISFAFSVTDVEPWSPDSPRLYLCRAELSAGETTSFVTERIGFRTIEAHGTEIMLNGQPIFLKGANRYDEYEPYGNCPPPELIREDFMNMKRCGMNLIRTHYPQDDLHYRIADEVGLMYMIEVPLNWWFPTDEETFDAYTDLAQQAIDSLNRIYENFANHPCWTIWSLSNECQHNTQAGEAMFRLLAGKARAKNSGRLITNVTCFAIKNSTELDYCDFIAVNTYHGACEDRLSDLPEKAEAASYNHLMGVQALYPDKPLVMTEFGGNSVRGLRGDGGRLTETQHAAVIRSVCNAFLRIDHMRGLVLWCWADYFHHRLLINTQPKGMHITGPYGPYGIVTVDRKIKTLPYEAMREVFQSID